MEMKKWNGFIQMQSRNKDAFCEWRGLGGYLFMKKGKSNCPAHAIFHADDYPGARSNQADPPEI